MDLVNEEMVEGEIGIYTCKTKKKEKFLIAFKIINEIGRYELFADLILAQHQSYHRKRRRKPFNNFANPQTKAVQSPSAFIGFTLHRMNPTYAYGCSKTQTYIYACI